MADCPIPQSKNQVEYITMYKSNAIPCIIQRIHDFKTIICLKYSEVDEKLFPKPWISVRFHEYLIDIYCKTGISI